MSIFLNKAAEEAAVKALGEDIGYGRIIQLAHRFWDEMLETKHGIKNHSEDWTLAAADIIRERRGDGTGRDPSPPVIEGESSRETNEYLDPPPDRGRADLPRLVKGIIEQAMGDGITELRFETHEQIADKATAEILSLIEKGAR